MFRPGIHRRTSLAGSVFVVAMLMGAAAAPTTRNSAHNPHWKETGCAACHVVSAGRAQPIDAAQIDKLCLTCHDGKRAVAEAHPVHRRFERSEALIRPANLPVIDDELGCITCHDSQLACDIPANARRGNRQFLRIQIDGNGAPVPFCQACHREQAYEKINPHLTLDSAGRIMESRCLFCHTRTPDRKAAQRTYKPDLKAPEQLICRDCHPPHRDPITEKHIGLRPSAEQQAYTRAMETLGLSGNPSRKLIHEIQAAGQMPRLFVTGPEGLMVCSTCHNPHQQGLFRAGGELDYGSMRFDARQKLVSPVRDPIWCRNCHVM